MKVSNGFKDILMKTAMVDSTLKSFIVEFVEGTLPTKAEIQAALIDTWTGTVSDLVYYTRISPLKLHSNFLAGRSETVLAYNAYNSLAEGWVTSNGQAKLDLTQWSGDSTYLSDGTIGYAVIYPRIAVSDYNYQYAPSMMFASVGEIGSGADIELTSLAVTQGIDIRMNELVLNF